MKIKYYIFSIYPYFLLYYNSVLKNIDLKILVLMRYKKTNKEK